MASTFLQVALKCPYPRAQGPSGAIATKHDSVCRVESHTMLSWIGHVNLLFPTNMGNASLAVCEYYCNTLTQTIKMVPVFFQIN